jgi:hypothetical protein
MISPLTCLTLSQFSAPGDVNGLLDNSSLGPQQVVPSNYTPSMEVDDPNLRTILAPHSSSVSADASSSANDPPSVLGTGNLSDYLASGLPDPSSSNNTSIISADNAAVSSTSRAIEHSSNLVLDDHVSSSGNPDAWKKQYRKRESLAHCEFLDSLTFPTADGELPSVLKDSCCGDGGEAPAYWDGDAIRERASSLVHAPQIVVISPPMSGDAV